MLPRVSIAIPVYNGEAFLEDAVRSILNQTFGDIEVLISDNASTDRTEAICRSFASEDARVKYHRNAENIGAGPNFNRAFGLARGEFFKWQAHDDLLSPTYVERCVAVLDAQSDVSLVFGRTQCIDENGVEIDWDEELFMPPIEDEDPVRRFRDAIRSTGSCFPVFGMFRRDLLKKTTLHRPYYSSDNILLCEIALLGKVAQAADDAVLFNREHRTRSPTHSYDKAMRAQWMVGTASRFSSLEAIQQIRHLFEISMRHRPEVSSLRTVGVAMQHAASRRQIARCGLDVIRLVSPAWGERVRRAYHGIPRKSGEA